MPAGFGDPVPGAILKKFEVRLKIILAKIDKRDSAGLKVLGGQESCLSILHRVNARKSGTA